ncbi:MAG: VWA domain-containing protein, partial [Pseudomonadota bacterium]|nr:VWA domain-containing protein [Pseudomonadota bacterium]
MLEEFHFLRPIWFAALVVLLPLSWYWFKRTRSASGWRSAVSKELLAVLLDAQQPRSGRWLRGLMLTAIVVGIVGLAGPTWEKLPQNVQQKNDALIILLDLSLSMWAEDVKPSRIVRARQKVADILRQREEGLTALIAYAGDAHAVVPLTDDVATIENLLGALDPGMMPVLGSNPGHGLELATELFSNANMNEGRVLIISDGIDSISSVTRHRNRAYPISIIGVGSYEGGAIPLEAPTESRRYLLSQEGNRIVALLDEQRLAEVASLS